MRQKSLIAVVGVLMAVAVASSVAAELQSPRKRVITLGLLLPPGATKEFKITAPEDGAATVWLPDLGQFAFAPRFRKSDNKTVVVTVFDTSTKPRTAMGTVDLPIGGKAVQSKTKPSFAIRVISVK